MEIRKRGRPRKIILEQKKEVSMTAALNTEQKQEEKKIELTTKIKDRELYEIEDRKPVTGVFRFSFKNEGILYIGAMRKYKGESLEKRVFEHGKTYTIPKWMADWLNGKVAERQGDVPGSAKIIHMDQWNDLHHKKPLNDPKRKENYSFTPVASW